MIKTEMVGERIRHISDAGYYIRQIETQKLYEDAVDVMPCAYTYEEAETLIPVPEPELTAEENTPAWDISQGEYIPVGFLLNRDGVTYECIVGHYAAWNKQPPNETYWKEML